MKKNQCYFGYSELTNTFYLVQGENKASCNETVKNMIAKHWDFWKKEILDKRDAMYEKDK